MGTRPSLRPARQSETAARSRHEPLVCLGQRGTRVTLPSGEWPRTTQYIGRGSVSVVEAMCEGAPSAR